MDEIFSNCINLEYINLNNFDESKLGIHQLMFFNVPENVVICIDEIKNPAKIIPQIKSKSCYTIDCSKDWKYFQKKFINNTNICVESCTSDYKYEYNGKCIKNCINGILSDDNGMETNKCKCEINKCLSCSKVALTIDLCLECNRNDNYYPIEDDPLNIGKYINCYKEPEGYYFSFGIYKKCYYTCKTCNKKGNSTFHNCLECNKYFPIEIRINNIYCNCFANLSSDPFLNSKNIYHTIIDLSNIDEVPKMTDNNLENYEKNFIDKIKNILDNKVNDTIKKTREEEIKFYDDILEIIEKGFISGNYDISNLDKGNDDIIKTEKLIITFTTTKNQKINIKNNMTTIDLGECETLLRKFYKIENNETLYMKKFDIFQDEMKTLKVEYDIYSKLYGGNLVKLNLTVCKDSKISISIPFVITENLDKFNSSSGYYNDICYTTTSEEGTDISLKDRQKEYINKDKIICQEDCHFSEYDDKTFKAKCSCKVKESSPSTTDMYNNKEKLIENFKNIKNIVNINFLVCYKKIFNKEGILNNIGCYLILVIILFHIISIFIFSKSSFPLIKKKIDKIIYGIYEYKSVNEKDKSDKSNKSKNFDWSEIFIYKNNKKSNNKKIYISNKKYINDNIIKINSKSKIINQYKIKKIKIRNNYINEEINGLSYNLAMQYDKRTFCQYYISLLKIQHNLIRALFNKDDYNSGIIKIDLFFIGFTIEYTVNGLFYNDDTMHKIYESKGQFNLESQIPIIVYSIIISYIFNLPLNFFALSNDVIISFKRDRTKNNIIKKAKSLKKVLACKFFLYFIISFLFLFFFWYYISLFDVIYKNTQIHLLKDTLMSFGLSLFIPFVIYLFPGFFRIPALSNRKNKREYLYNFSKFLQSF